MLVEGFPETLADAILTCLNGSAPKLKVFDAERYVESALAEFYANLNRTVD